MATPKPISPFRLSSLLRSEKDPSKALKLFLHPNPTQPKPFRHSLLSYDLLITKLGRAKMFLEMEQILHRLCHHTTFCVPEPLLCQVITLYGRNRLPSSAIHTFLSLGSFRCTPTVKSFNSLLNALLTSRDFQNFSEFASRVMEFTQPDTCTFNILINAWCLRGNIDCAWKVFDEMRDLGVPPSEVTFGTLINGLCKSMRLQEALKLKEVMIKDHKLKPNVNLYTTLIKGGCVVGEMDRVFRIKDEMVRNNVKLDAAVYNTLMGALFKAGRKDEGWQVLDEMNKNGCKPDLVTYNVMIAEFCSENNFEEVFRILDGMEGGGVKPDVVIYNVIIGWLCKTGKCNEANDLFQDMPRRGCTPDVVTYRTLFDGLCGWMHLSEAALILDEMLFKGYAPLSRSLNRFIDGMCSEGNFELLLTVLSSLGRKEDILNEDIWKIVVSMVFKPKELQENFDFELLDTLVVQYQT
ncbi:hypothetical protein HN51_027441 [Arachis hypogaea]|uniref:Pentatricopeptide repeat-containing protein n=1 Tax=Arachis hypogaea TaxID=3818 RepID=A0A445BN13_ARAHY|nr:putative pentatricopeptide repeat-containing protein At1g53330 [Arachis hypogaea]XP_025618307.1 putative pentatricopeptide repeat-containing protein At1g53330 [Arachis hypogaea]XP_029144730.1 putative pentatricopeptide repeat-containing protein At1g53330 [Arachis hypogaea]XP_029144731.1 putative pentatricopeptide repeat-containing protein At1g53330 [Arachis hypogaea]QHO33797.1 Putative pentatricopeptide repeat-containing protein [Arachis hypogaea]QHO33798.1 Putative pentatricopeptide repeat